VSEKCAVCGLTGHTPQEHVLPRVTVESLKAKLAAAEAERDRLRALGNELWASSDDDTAKAAWLRALAPVEPAREEEP
jgi:hypothetical protein